MLHRDTADYSVFHYRPATGATFRPPDAAFETGVYDAAILELSDALDRQPSITTVHGLPGYDRLGVIDEALLERLPTATPGATVLVTHPGQGALAAGILMRQPQAWFQLVDRDLLALRTTRRALLALGATEARVQTHAVGTWHAQALPAAADLVVGALHEGAGTAAVAAEYRGLVRAIAPGGRALLASSSTAATRLLDVTLPAGLKVTRTRHRGTSFLQLARSA
jgi:hypothetical protein